MCELVDLRDFCKKEPISGPQSSRLSSLVISCMQRKLPHVPLHQSESLISLHGKDLASLYPPYCSEQRKREGRKVSSALDLIHP